MAAPPAAVVNTSGAGDCLVAGTLFGLLQGFSVVKALAHGMVHNTPALVFPSGSTAPYVLLGLLDLLSGALNVTNWRQPINRMLQFVPASC